MSPGAALAIQMFAIAFFMIIVPLALVKPSRLVRRLLGE